MKTAALAGGVGGAKLLIGLRHFSDALTAIVNTGDDAEIYGVHVSPDLDIVTYWLAGIADTDQGWGIKGDSFGAMEGFAELGYDTWFRLGDRDLATCLARTQRLAAGATLTSVTDEFRRALGIDAEILPMSDDPVRTKIVTDDDRVLDFQDYFVKERGEVVVSEVLFDGISGAKPGPDVVERLRTAQRVVICPSNPFLSTGPILALPGVRDAVREHPRVIAVSPIVGGDAIKGPLAAMLRARGQEVSPVSIAEIYRGLCELFVIDERDAALEDEVAEAARCEVMVTSTIMDSEVASKELAGKLLS